MLIAEDDEDEAFLIRRAFQKNCIRNPGRHVTDGEAAIDFLNHCAKKQIELPALVLLDIKMPRFTGLEVLNWIRSRPELASIPVVMLTNSNQTQDVDRAIHMGATDYIVKPVTFDDLVMVVQKIKERWLTTGEGPLAVKPE